MMDIDHFKNSINHGNSVLRAIHYPPVASGESGERAGAHGDINLITLLIGGHKPGLEILFENKWVPINTEQNTVVCNIGDMLLLLSPAAASRMREISCFAARHGSSGCGGCGRAGVR